MVSCFLFPFSFADVPKNSERNVCALTALPQIFHNLSDPRKPRGVWYPFAALCSLVFLEMLARIIEMAVLVRWAETHWQTLKEPLDFDRNKPPSATCISRTLAGLSLQEFRQYFAAWLLPLFKDMEILKSSSMFSCTN